MKISYKIYVAFSLILVILISLSLSSCVVHATAPAPASASCPFHATVISYKQTFHQAAGAIYRGNTKIDVPEFDIYDVVLKINSSTSKDNLCPTKGEEITSSLIATNPDSYVQPTMTGKDILVNGIIIEGTLLAMDSSNIGLSKTFTLNQISIVTKVLNSATNTPIIISTSTSLMATSTSDVQVISQPIPKRFVWWNPFTWFGY